MKPTTTDDLLRELLSTKDLDSFLSTNKDKISNISLTDFLNALLAAKNKRKADVIREAQLGTPYGYQLFSGEKISPARDKLLQLAFGFSLTLEETQKLLRVGQVGSLYVKNRRDSIIIFALETKKSLVEANILLDKEGESPLYS